MCVNCREMKPKKDMIRLVRVTQSATQTQAVETDMTTRAVEPIAKAAGKDVTTCGAVMTATKAVVIDVTGKMPGRGAYVCIDEECVKAAKKQKKIERSFQVSGCDELYESLLAMVGNERNEQD